MVFAPAVDLSVVDGLQLLDHLDEAQVLILEDIPGLRKRITVRDIDTLKIDSLTRADAKFRVVVGDFSVEPEPNEHIRDENNDVWRIVAVFPRVLEGQYELICVPASSPQAELLLRTLTLTSVDTQYSLALGKVRAVGARIRQQWGTVRVALESGKVATPVEPFHSLYASERLSLTVNPPGDTTLYAATDTAGSVLEIWSR